MSTFTYFAYGSNMLTERLRARCPSAHPLGVAHVEGHRLAFASHSDQDGSGKATLEVAKGRVYGVLFAIEHAERGALDRAESGYDGREIAVTPVTCVTRARREAVHMAHSYFARRCTAGLRPFAWYHALIICGARQHRLPADYLAGLLAVACHIDPEPHRRARHIALAALGQAGFFTAAPP